MEPSQLRLFDLLPLRRRSVEPKVEPRGRSCDLAAVAAEINRRWFGGELTAAITWGRRRPRRRRRRRPRRISMQLGSYHQQQDLVRIHPALDQPWVPRYVIESVIYHELLHAALPPVEKGGRRCVHTAEFKRRERLFPRLDEAQAWIRENLGKLIAAA
jgi:predicted metal-dependent hydrolase